MIDENALHETGRRIKNALEGIALQIAESAGSLNAYIYLIMDAQLNIKDKCFILLITRKMLKMLEPHTALFVAPTGVGEIRLALDLLKRKYFNHFDFIIIIYTTLRYHSTYKSRK